MPLTASIKKRSEDRVVIGLDKAQGKTILLAIVQRLLHQRRVHQRRLLAQVDLVDDLGIVAKNLVGVIGEILLVAVDEFQKRQQRGKIVVVVIDTIERGLELNTQLRYGEHNHRRFIYLGVIGQFI